MYYSHHKVNFKSNYLEDFIGISEKKANFVFQIMNFLIQEKIKEAQKLQLEVLQNKELLDKVAEIATLLIESFKAENQLFLCGNGGSASDAMHLATEFSGRYYLDRKPLNAQALNVNAAELTAVSNDFGYEKVFARILESRAKKNDILWVFSTSGNSPNIVQVLEKAKSLKIKTIAFTGITGGKIMHLADYVVNVPSTDTPRIQEIHILLGHIICEIVEKEIFGKVKS